MTGLPIWIDILWKWANMLTKLAWDDKLGWLCSMRSEIFLQIKFIIFQSCLTKQAAFLPENPLHRIVSLFSNFCLFRKAILQKILKLRFWNFKLIFLRMHFQGFFQALCYTTVFVFQIEFVKRSKPFSYAKDMKKSVRGEKEIRSTRKLKVFGLWESLTLA